MAICPLCKQEHRIEGYPKSASSNVYYCDNFTSIIDDRVIEYVQGVEKERRLNAIYNFLFKHPFANEQKNYWRFFYQETNESPINNIDVNVYHLMRNYPYNIEERINAILLNLHQLYPSMSDTFTISDWSKYSRLFYSEYENDLGKLSDELTNIVSILRNLGYVDIRGNKDKMIYYQTFVLTYNGLKKINELQEQNKSSRNIFIAMSFKEDYKYIGQAFKDAIIDAGFQPIIINDKEHNNYIMPQIFYEIENCAAVVMDLTEPNNGAYYEAGYALGHNKEVIACCKRTTFEDKDKRPHFDIAQKSMIIWDDVEDLKQKLTKRIKYTIIVDK